MIPAQAFRTNDDEIVISGIGLATSLGSDREGTWTALCSGRSGAEMLAESGYAGYPVPPGLIPPADLEPAHALARHTAYEALNDAGLAIVQAGGVRWPCPPERVGILLGLSKGGLRGLDRAARDVQPRGSSSRFDSAQSPFLDAWPHASASRLSFELDARGPCLAPIAACATGLIAVLQAAALIRGGSCDLALAGAADSSLEPLILAAFRSMRALAFVGDEPATAVRPWDRNRSGFLLGEGAAVLVLERASHAQARGITPYAILAGGALGCDAHHITAQSDDPAPLIHVIRQAVASSGVKLDEIDHVNVHGTATRTNDPLECRALREALGPRADAITCSANKAQIGHLLGAAGAAELAIACLTLRDQVVPPTRNRDDPDPACDLKIVLDQARPAVIRHALKLSLGFGGHLAVAVLKHPGGPSRAGAKARE